MKSYTEYLTFETSKRKEMVHILVACAMDPHKHWDMTK
jgi:hypothetical protein